MSALKHLAYSTGQQDAAASLLGKLYDRHIKGDLGPLASSFITSSPHGAALAGGVVQAIDTPPEGSRILRSLGVAGGGALGNKLVASTASAVASAIVSALGLPSTGLLHMFLRGIPTGAAQHFLAAKGRDAAKYLETRLKEKGVEIP